MNFTRATLAATALILALTGCATPGVHAAVNPDAAYLAAVHTAAPTLNDTRDAVLVDSGKGVCTALNKGATAAGLSARAVQGGLALEEGNAIIQSAIDAYCPTHVWKLDA